MKRLSTAKPTIRTKGTKNIQARGWASITGRTMPIDQLSSVMIWKSEYIDCPTVPNHCGNSRPKSSVAITEET